MYWCDPDPPQTDFKQTSNRLQSSHVDHTNIYIYIYIYSPPPPYKTWSNSALIRHGLVFGLMPAIFDNIVHLKMGGYNSENRLVWGVEHFNFCQIF